MKKWAKITLLAAPLVLGSSFYAFADEKSTGQAAITIEQVKPAEPATANTSTTTATTGSTSASSQAEFPNPFLVQQEPQQTQTNGEQSATTTTGQRSAAAQSAANQPLSIDQIRKLQINAKSDRGDLKLEYQLEGNGTPRLNGEIGDVKVHLSGDKAKEMTNQFLTRWQLLDNLQQVLADPNGTLHAQAILALQEFELETVGGKRIELDQEKLKAIVEGKQETKGKEKEAKEKREDKGKHKGHQKNDKDDD
ncbi:hypothetical protein [Effusibacillus pohliae]|uniref:hypothetical protein n=1 Tax=Effusibacillus pohliae TaxID=232270 RepID=UPI0003787BAD|nr:hypothetical protein [Effusibacillus pohliae]